MAEVKEQIGFVNNPEHSQCWQGSRHGSSDENHINQWQLLAVTGTGCWKEREALDALGEAHAQDARHTWREPCTHRYIISSNFLRFGNSFFSLNPTSLLDRCRRHHHQQQHQQQQQQRRRRVSLSFASFFCISMRIFLGPPAERFDPRGSVLIPASDRHCKPAACPLPAWLPGQGSQRAAEGRPPSPATATSTIGG